MTLRAHIIVANQANCPTPSTPPTPKLGVEGVGGVGQSACFPTTVRIRAHAQEKSHFQTHGGVRKWLALIGGLP